jgi:hypothetical protein
MSKTKKIILIGALIAVVLVAGWYGFQKYENWSFWREMKSQADKFTAEQDRLKALVEADTYGGKTPQETLEMFIVAVEAGNYELASKYFVVEKQGGELKSLKEAEKKDIENVIGLLKGTKDFAGDYSNDKKHFLVRTPILVEYILYPSNLWKINEI